MWDTRGNITFDAKPRMKRVSDTTRPLLWLPDNSGWLLYGRKIFDRKLKRILWQYPAAWHEEVYARFVGNKDTLLLSAGGKSLATVGVAWDRINRSVVAMGGKENHPLRPGGAIALELNVGELQFGGDKAETEKVFREKLAQRLAMDDLKLQDGSPVVLKLDYAEKAGERVKVFNMRHQFDLRGVDTGQTVQNTTASMKVRLVANGQAVFEDTLSSGGLGRTFKEEITEGLFRKVALENMANQLPELPIPYFIPAAAELEPLPLIAD